MQWSPDQELVVLITGESSLILITREFDVISECFLHNNDVEHGISSISSFLFQSFIGAPVNVGWGKKETQFHGSAGKEAAKESKCSKNKGLSKNDDGKIRISWRGDGNFFVVSFIAQGIFIFLIFSDSF